MLPDEPVFAFVSVAVIVVVSTTASFVLIVNPPLVKVLELSPKVVSPLLSNCMLPDPLVIVTTVELSVVTVLLFMSLAVTEVLNATPVGCGDVALTT